ncbi:MAG TPA: hypothetical protein VKX28_07570 [Xanthobacteraceae bacterium]|nr:hypothetical protein [Xanthobacteraceae bacterium]
MAFRFVVIGSVIGVLAAVPPASAASPGDKDIDPNLPRHADVCSGGFVAKKQLAYQLLVNVKATHAIMRISAGPDLWHRIFVDDHFCPVPSITVCAKDPKSDACKAAKSCESDQLAAQDAATSFFRAVNVNVHIHRSTKAYAPSQALLKLNGNDPDPAVGIPAQVELFFAAGTANDDRDTKSSIACTADEPPAPPAPYNALNDTSPLSKLRLRGLSDDLYIDRTNPNFKATTAASGSFSDDTHAAHTSTAKITASLGYTFDLPFNTEIVPYVSINESLTDTQLKPRVKDPTNSVAAGVLFERFFLNPDRPEITHVLSIKPQYLGNTTDHSQLASARMIYAPWIDSPFFNLNTFRELPFLPGPTWGQILFDIRNDAGTYTNRGNMPAIVTANRDFDRIGSRVGLVLTTDNFPSVTFNVTETYMYGVTGFYRSVENTQASVTYNLVNSYLGLTASYKRGRDIDTAVASQIWMLSLTGRY